MLESRLELGVVPTFFVVLDLLWPGALPELYFGREWVNAIVQIITAKNHPPIYG